MWQKVFQRATAAAAASASRGPSLRSSARFVTTTSFALVASASITVATTAPSTTEIAHCNDSGCSCSTPSLIKQAECFTDADYDSEFIDEVGGGEAKFFNDLAASLQVQLPSNTKVSSSSFIALMNLDAIGYVGNDEDTANAAASGQSGNSSSSSSSSSSNTSPSHRLRAMFESNEKFVDSKEFLRHSLDRKNARPSRCVIVTCMDTRLTTLLPAALDIRPGDAKIIKNAGAMIAHPFGSSMRSVIVALYMLSADEVFVIGHYDCGMSNVNTPAAIHYMLDRGNIPPDTLRTLASAGIDLHRWLHGFDSVQESVRTSVDIIRNHPLVPHHVPVHGLIIDPHTGKLDLVVDGSRHVQPPPPSSKGGGSGGNGGGNKTTSSHSNNAVIQSVLSPAGNVSISGAHH